MTDPLIQAVHGMATLPDDVKISIRNKLYAPVSVRVQAFREAYGSKGRIITTIHHSNENRVLIEAQVSVFDGVKWQLIANDFAEEFRNDGPINKTSATENCSTSAIGRALSACGLSGGEYASFEEVDYAINDKAAIDSPAEPAVDLVAVQNHDNDWAEEAPDEMFKRISAQSIEDMKEAKDGFEVDRIGKDAMADLVPWRAMIEEEEWEKWIDRMGKLHAEKSKKAEKKRNEEMIDE